MGAYLPGVNDVADDEGLTPAQRRLPPLKLPGQTGGDNLQAGPGGMGAGSPRCAGVTPPSSIRRRRMRRFLRVRALSTYVRLDEMTALRTPELD